MWLLSWGRTEEAKQTLKKIRGDVSDEKCAAEFEDMVRYVSEMNQNNNSSTGKYLPLRSIVRSTRFINRLISIRHAFKLLITSTHR